MGYQLVTDATADLNAALLAGLPPITVLPMEIVLDGQPYTYGPGGDITVEEFYAAQRAGKFAHTSQISPATYLQCFEACMKAGVDVLYLCFSSGLSGTFQTATLCAQEVQAQYPARKILCVDTLGASLGEGLLVREAARRQAAGEPMKALAAWVQQHRGKVCHWFTIDTFAHLRHGGRVSAAAAMMGTALNIKPLLHVATDGTLQPAGKIRGIHKSMLEQAARMEAGWLPALGTHVLIGHGDCPERAQALADILHKKFATAEIAFAPIGPVIGAHSGPGTLALFYWGSNR
ncbi:MAG: DegV family protein [Gemmiger sp.]|nr:DegV family protein [Gemmiger sp.]